MRFVFVDETLSSIVPSKKLLKSVQHEDAIPLLQDIRMRYTMDDYLKEALEIARAQASVRVMSEEEIT